LVKASEFLRAAEDALYLANHTAATGNAVHAGIAAADAIAAVRSASIWRGPHDQASLHLERAGTECKQAARHLRRLIPLPLGVLEGLSWSGAISGARRCQSPAAFVPSIARGSRGRNVSPTVARA
jgi:hypothetical protein